MNEKERQAVQELETRLLDEGKSRGEVAEEIVRRRIKKLKEEYDFFDEECEDIRDNVLVEMETYRTWPRYCPDREGWFILADIVDRLDAIACRMAAQPLNWKEFEKLVRDMRVGFTAYEIVFMENGAEEVETPNRFSNAPYFERRFIIGDEDRAEETARAYADDIAGDFDFDGYEMKGHDIDGLSVIV